MDTLPVVLLNKIVVKTKNISNFRKICLKLAILRVKVKHIILHYGCGY